ncbi:hypothetical protein AAIA71_28715 (plasmid) [Vibrio harveyi]|uniref:hypothetical protein n=1 Tax=Vibrio harveyi TaxID=669 RepID=UPI00247FBC7B|nr:hypothetical protein [Vibrio harveyi]
MLISTMTKEQFVQVRDLLGYSNLELGKELGYTHTLYQCKQVDNLVSGASEIKYVVVLALECLARRKSKFREFKSIIQESI